MLLAVSINTWPSAGLSISARIAMLVPAPGRFSTITGWPSRVPICWPTARAMMSTAPPGAKPTIRRMGLAGKAWVWVWAWAAPAAASKATLAATISAINGRRREFLFIGLSPAVLCTL